MSLAHVVISIVLLTSMIGTTAFYLNSSKALSRVEARNFTVKFEAVDEAWHAYRTDNEMLTCSNPIDPSGCAKWAVSSPGYLPATNWWANLAPEYILMPALPANFTWAYDETGYGHYFCAFGNGNTILLEAAQFYQSRADYDQVVISSSCGASSQGALPSGISAWAITYWINIK